MADMYLGNESGGFDLVGTTNIKNIDFEEVKISKEDYENLSEEERKTGIHLVTGLDDTENGGGSADLISYDNTNSGLGSTNVQGAIDELNSNLTQIIDQFNNITLLETQHGSIVVANVQYGAGAVNRQVLFDTPFYKGIPNITITEVNWGSMHSSITIGDVTQTGFTFTIGCISNVSGTTKTFTLEWIAEVLKQ